MIEVCKVILHRLDMELKHPFRNSLQEVNKKDLFIVEVIDQDGNHGFGETVSFTSPWYTEETTETNLHVIESFLIPLLMNQTFEHPDHVSSLFEQVRRNHMAKAAVEGAVWDLYAKRLGEPLWKVIGGTKPSVDVGVSIGMQSSIQELVHVIKHNVDAGYKRVKLKVKPGWDIEVLREVRARFPDLAIMVDANSAYTVADMEHLRKFDQFKLMMIEQPFAHDDFIDHARLQQELETPICLDESIHTLNDARNAIALGSCQIINIKVGRVGGITTAKKIHQLCAENNIDVWCGGMLEAGVGRAHSLAISTLPQFTLPGDTSASSRYWHRDIITPEVTMEKGLVTLPDAPGIGYEIDWDAVDAYRVDRRVYG